MTLTLVSGGTAGSSSIVRRLAAAAAALVLALGLSSCSFLTSFDDLSSEPAAGTLEAALDDLVSTESFADDGTEHILSGEINSRGQAVGYHSTALGDLASGEVVPGTQSAQDGHGLYKAQVVVDGTGKTSNDGYSTFFPDAWTAQQVVDAINEAYASRVSSGDGGYDGVTSGGISVHMYLDDFGLVVTAYPVMEY
ncbi:EndoU domain-containing protein [Sanguibacter antarcticus]|uniref:EndoU nuclease-like protein n=1 Tax=Sanguibacter antarcticus TaxID=372484 RepID=A0A2A9E5B7_9MICO|nr:EndoU domain-containing protein [Sanguibacter antarcticus]PFG34247.1 EndoU nuclease-like protein [Sanguibacter antarcticus]